MIEQERATTTHALIRTSPKGELFLGTCTLCGTPNLPMRAACEPCPNQRGLSQDEALIDVIEASFGASPEYSDEDMAEVGQALMAAIETHASSSNPDDPLFRWHPAQCPSEVVGDLVEMVRQARAAAAPVVTDEMVEAAVRAGMIDLSKSGPMPTLRDQARAMIEAALAVPHERIAP